MKVHEIMTGHPRSVAPDTTLVEAAGLMRELDVGALPVCTGDDLAGIVTDRDLVVRGIADGHDPATTKVSDVMSGGVEAVSADDDVENAVRIMEQRQIRRLPVLNRAKELVGMVSLGDIATSSNPAFGGTALRDVSEPNEPSARRRRLERDSEPIRMPMQKARAPRARSGLDRDTSSRASAGRDHAGRGRTKTTRRQTTKSSRTNSSRSGRSRGTSRSKPTRSRKKSSARR